MNIFRLLFAAFGIQCAALGGGLIAAGALAAVLPEFRSSQLDQPNHFLPMLLTLTAFGGVLVLLALEKRRAKSVILGFVALSLVAGGLPVGREYLARTLDQMNASEPKERDFKLLQFNVLGENPYPPLARRRIVEAGADVATLQEPHPEVMTAPELMQAYPYRTPCVGDVCLAAIWSKRPITAWHYDQLDIPNTQPPIRLDILWADTTGPDGKPVRVMTTHYGWPWPPKFQRPQRVALRDYLRDFDKRDMILAGDFNSAPWSVAMRRQDRHFLPLKRRTRALYTWPAYVPRVFWPTHMGLLPIDHVYAGDAWRTVKVERLSRGASDHYPVMVTLRRETAP
jgi:endonuclease/exonuclease/phosphatase (EEP) superfamily protein YafD